MNNKLLALAGAVFVVGVLVAGVTSINSAGKQLSETTLVNSVNLGNNTSGFSAVGSSQNVSQNVNGVTFTQPEVALPKDTVKKIRTLEIDLSRTINLEGPISFNAIDASIRLAIMNQESSKPITILLNSPGGSVIAGARLISAMQASKAKVNTVCLSMCASMAFMIHQYGSERLALDRAILMSHPASVGYSGDVDRIMSFIGTIQRYTNKLEAEVSKRIGISFDEYKKKSSVEYWVDSEDALRDNVVDGLVNLTTQDSLAELAKFNTNTTTKTEAKAILTNPRDILWIMPGYLD